MAGQCGSGFLIGQPGSGRGEALVCSTWPPVRAPVRKNLKNRLAAESNLHCMFYLLPRIRRHKKACVGLIVAVSALMSAAAPSTPSQPKSAESALAVNASARQVIVPAAVLKQGVHVELKGAIEYLLVSNGGKEYESVFGTSIDPEALAQALRQIGLRGGAPASEGRPPRGQPICIWVEFEKEGKLLRPSAEALIWNMKLGQPMSTGSWTVTGSAQAKDPATGQTLLQASLTRSLIGLHVTDGSPLIQNPRPESVSENIYAANLKALPPPGTKVRLIIEAIVPKIPPGTRRALVQVTGRVTGVGFRNFTQNQAAALELKGYVKNVAEDRVEALIEGPTGKVAQLVEKMKRGPLSARVEKIEVKDLPPEADFDRFEIQY